MSTTPHSRRSLLRMRRSTALAVAIVTLSGGIGLGGGVLAATVTRHGSSNQPAVASPIYYLDGVIHDGTTTVSFHPSAGRTVLAVVRTLDGWVVSERAGQDEGALVLVHPNGTTKTVDTLGGTGFEVSPDGDAIAFGYGTGSAVRVVSPFNGRVLQRLTAPLASTRELRYGGDQLVVDGFTQTGALHIVRDDFVSDRWLPVRLDLPGSPSLEDVSSDGSRIVVSYLHNDVPCTAVARLDKPTLPTWASCAEQPGAHSSFSPDGSTLLTIDDPSGGAAGIVAVRAADGHRVRVFPGSRWLTGLSWVSNDDLLIASATSAQYDAFTLRQCAISTGTCHYLPGATPHAPASSAAVGWSG